MKYFIHRESFSSGLAVFFATLGSAVGLGNIWKFPYLTGENGGGAFLLVYFLCVIFVGLPVMISEFYIGRKTRKNAVGAFKVLQPGSAWKSIGLMGVVSAFLIMFFYSSVAGWVYSYVIKALLGNLNNVTVESAQAQFNSTIDTVYYPILWQVVVLTVVSLILISGVQKGIERITKTLIPLLFILIILCDIRALTLPNADAGIRFLLEVDFSKLTAPVILTALGLAFFKLSLGMGTMITYGSYFTQDNNMVNTSLRVAISDTLVSLLAGLAIFPAVFAFGLEPAQGPGLLFMTIPLVFSKMAFGNILLIAFFLLSSIAATTAMISLVEVPVAYFSEEKRMSRTAAVILSALIIIAFGSLASLSAGESSPLGTYKILFDKTFFALFDFTSSNILLPLGGLLISLFIALRVKKDSLRKELSNQGDLNNEVIITFYHLIVRFVTPVLLLVIFLYYTGILKIGD